MLPKNRYGATLDVNDIMMLNYFCDFNSKDVFYQVIFITKLTKYKAHVQMHMLCWSNDINDVLFS